MDVDRMTGGVLRVDDVDLDVTLRPRSLEEFVGQERIKEQLALLIEGYRRIDTLNPETQADIRTLIGWPVAGFPLPMPHFTAEADVSSLPMSELPVFPDEPPQAESTAATASVDAAATAARRYLVILRVLQNLRRSIG